MCNFCRLLIKSLLLTSIVSAVPLGRQKRNISFFKDLFTSTFYGNDGRTLQIPDVQAEPDCMLYIVPGYSDILSQPMETAADEEAIPNEGKKERIPYRIESNIGTKNSVDTAEANVVPETRMRDTVVPMIKGRNAVKFVVEENVIPDPVISEEIQTNRHKAVLYPRRNGRMRTVNFKGVKNLRTIPVYPEKLQQVIPEKLTPHHLRLLKPVDGKYSPKLIERTGSIIRFTPRSYPEVKYRENFITIPNLPVPRIDEVISLPDDEYEIVPVIRNHYPYLRQRFIPSESEFYLRKTSKKIVPLNSKPLHLVDSDEHKVENKHLLNLNRNIHEKMTSNENSTLKVLKLMPKVYHISNITTTENITNNVYDAQIDKTISPQKDHSYSKSFKVVKEKDEINTDTPFANHQVNESPVKNITEIVKKTKDKIISKNIVKTVDIPKSESLAQYIKELVRNNKTHPVDLEKFKDELQTNFNTDLTNFTDIDSILDIVSMNINNSNVKIPIDIKIKDLATPKDNVDITPVLEVMPLNNNNNSNITKHSDIKTIDETALFKPKDLSFSHNIYENYSNPHPLSELQDRDNSMAIVNNNSLAKNPSDVNNLSVAKTNDNAISQNSNINGPDKVLNNPQNVDFHLRDIIFNLLNILEENNEPKTNINTNPTLPNQNISFSHIIEHLSTDKNNSNIVNPTGNNPQSIINQTVFNIAPDETKIKTNVVITSPLSIDKDLKTNDNAKSENSKINVVDKVSNNSQNIDFRLRDIIFNLLNILEENNEPKTNNPTLLNQNISFSHIIENLSTDRNDSNILNTTGNNPQNVINQTVFNNIEPDETKIKTNVVTTSPLSKDNDYMQAITNTPPTNYTVGQISDDKKEIIRTESTTVSSNIKKIPLGDTKNDQILSTDKSIVVIDDAPADKKNNLNINYSSSTVNGNDEKSNDISETTKTRGDIPEASF